MSREERAARWKGWGNHWEEIVVGETSLRQEQGRIFQAQKCVQQLTFSAGIARAWVRDLERYRVAINVPCYDEGEREVVLEAVTPRVAQQILDGDLSPKFEDALEQVGLHLLPRRGEVRTTCNCSDALARCKHVHAAFAEIQSRLDRDPLLVLELRGVNRHWLKSRVKAKAPPRPDRRPAGQSMPIQLVDMAAFYTEPEGAPKDIPVTRLKAPTLEDELPSALAEIWPPPEDDTELPDWVNGITYRAAGIAEGLLQGGGGDLPDELHTLLMELRFTLAED